MRGATEDEQPVHFLQAAQLDLAQRPGLLQLAEALLDQPWATQADGISRMPSGPAIQVAAPSLVVLRNMRSAVQLAAGGNKILRVVGIPADLASGSPETGLRRWGASTAKRAGWLRQHYRCGSLIRAWSAIR